MPSAIEEQLQRAIRDRYVLGPVIGEGGMATVYRAQDIRHHRDVALKLLKPELGAVLGAERFLSEIQVTAKLQHPHLLPLFDSGEADGLLFYVMPLVEGESLRARLDREHQLPVAEAVRITVAIAGALDYAHRHGVIHRDLKPENILLHDGQPLVADFGIALAVSRAGGERVTQTGISLGTPQYMSPEQAAAERSIDGRSDIYALGAVLYEMLTGEPPHTGPTMQAVIARVLTETPRSARAARASVPEHVAEAVDRALAKVAADRYDTAQQFAQALTASSVEFVSGQHAPRPRRATARSFAPLALGALALVVVSAGATWLWSKPGATTGAPTLRLLMKALPDAVESATITPDGRNLVYVGTSQGKRTLFLRAIDDFRAMPIAGTEDAMHPFISPDGKTIGYFTTDDKMRRIPITGGTPSVISPSFRLGYASWGGTGDGIIVTDFNRLGVLTWVAASGGDPVPLTRIDTAKGETAHFSPFVLPDGKTVVFGIEHETRGTQSKVGKLAIVSVSEATKGIAPHADLGIKGRAALGFVDGWLVYAGEDAGTVLAARLDVKNQRVDGAPVVVLQDAAGIIGAHLAGNGTLIYSHRAASDNEPMLVDAAGTTTPLFDAKQHGPYMNPRLSPDGKRLALQGTSPQGSDIWILDLTTHTSTRLTNTGSVLSPAWSSDGSRILYVDNHTGKADVMWQPVDGSGPPEKLFGAPEILVSEAMTPDNRTMVFQRQRENVWSIWSTAVGGGDARPVVSERFDNYMPSLSPDGHWLAYASTSSGTHEIYVRPYPGPGTPAQVSEGGGTEPAWSHDGRRLYYRNGTALLAATVATAPGFSVQSRQTLFRRTFEGEMPHTNFVPMADGRFIMIGASAGAEPDMVVVVNWLSELRARISGKGQD